MKYVIFILLFSISINGFAEIPGKIEGIVVDSLDQRPLNGIIVKISESYKKDITDSDGKFEFKELAPGIYELTFNSAWYKPLKLENVEVKSGENTNLQILLGKYDLLKTFTLEVPGKRDQFARYYLKIVKPDSTIDYKILELKPDPSVDYKIDITDPER